MPQGTLAAKLLCGHLPVTAAEGGSVLIPCMCPTLQYCYEGVGMILPIESSMKERERFGPVLSATIALITAIFLGFGAVSTLPADAGLLDQASLARRTVPMLPTYTSLHDKGSTGHIELSQWVMQR